MDASVLNRLDEIETAAQKVRAQTEDRKRELEKAADQKTAAFDAQIDADSAKKLDALRAQMQDQDRSRLDRSARRTLSSTGSTNITPPSSTAARTPS